MKNTVKQVTLVFETETAAKTIERLYVNINIGESKLETICCSVLRLPFDFYIKV